MGVAVKVDGVMVAAGAAVAVGTLVWLNRADLLAKVNPASQENVVWQSVNEAAGADNVATVADYVFGAVDLMSPWNESDYYATQVYGGGGYLDWLDGDIKIGMGSTQ